MEHEQDETEAPDFEGGELSEDELTRQYEQWKRSRELGDTARILDKKGLGKKRYRTVNVNSEFL